MLSFDLRKRTWSEMAPFPVVGSEFLCQVGDAVYVLTCNYDDDDDNSTKIFKYEMRKDIWTEVAEFPDFWKVGGGCGMEMVGEDIYMMGCPNDFDEHGPNLLKKFNLTRGVLSSAELPLPDRIEERIKELLQGQNFREVTEAPLSLSTIESDGYIYVSQVFSRDNVYS